MAGPPDGPDYKFVPDAAYVFSQEHVDGSLWIGNILTQEVIKYIRPPFPVELCDEERGFAFLAPVDETVQFKPVWVANLFKYAVIETTSGRFLLHRLTAHRLPLRQFFQGHHGVRIPFHDRRGQVKLLCAAIFLMRNQGCKVWFNIEQF